MELQTFSIKTLKCLIKFLCASLLRMRSALGQAEAESATLQKRKAEEWEALETDTLRRFGRTNG